MPKGKKVSRPTKSSVSSKSNGGSVSKGATVRAGISKYEVTPRKSKDKINAETFGNSMGYNTTTKAKQKAKKK